MYISYSGFKSYHQCHYQYWNQYINKTTKPEPENRIGMLYGSVVGRLFELFYNDKMWVSTRNIDSVLQGKVQEVVKYVVTQEIRKGGVFRWDVRKPVYPSLEALIDDVRTTIPRAIAIIREHRLIGEGSAAEVKLDVSIQGHILGGRCDFIVPRIKPFSDLVILDGKGSKYRERYVDETQLRWYGMLHRIKLSVVPDKLGFVFWKSEPAKSVDWVNFKVTEFDDLQRRALAVIDEIQKAERVCPACPGNRPPEEVEYKRLFDVFPPSPSSQCKLCSYLFTCPLGRNITTNKFRAPDTEGLGVQDVGID